MDLRLITVAALVAVALAVVATGRDDDVTIKQGPKSPADDIARHKRWCRVVSVVRAR